MAFNATSPCMLIHMYNSAYFHSPLRQTPISLEIIIMHSEIAQDLNSRSSVSFLFLSPKFQKGVLSTSSKVNAHSLCCVFYLFSSFKVVKVNPSKVVV